MTERPRILFLITRAPRAGAQTHVFGLIRAMKDNFSCHLATGHHGWLTEKTQALRVPTTVLPSLVRPINPIGDLRAVWGLWRLIRKVRPDLVSTHSTKAGLLGRFAAKRGGVPVILFTAHSWVFTEGASSWRRWLGPPLERCAAKYTTKIICVSEYDRQLALKHKITEPSKIEVIHNGVDPQPFLDARGDRIRREFGLGEVRIITTIGGLRPEKCQLTFLEAFRNLGDRNAVALLVGDGPLRHKLESFVAKNGLRGQVFFTGERQDVPNILAASDVITLSSRREGLPLAVIEAMLAGLPVVATQVGGVPELVQDGVTGLLVPPDDPEALARAMNKVLEDRAGAREMGKAGSKIALQRFTFDRMASRTVCLYRDLLCNTQTNDC